MWRRLVESVPIQALLTYFNPPVFDVKIIKVTNEVIAGQQTHVCTVTVSLPGVYRQQNPDIIIVIPRPTLRVTGSGRLLVREIPPDASNVNTEALTLAVLVEATSVDTYYITAHLLDGTNFNLTSDAATEGDFIVIPSRAAQLSLSSIYAAETGHGIGRSIYRGGKAKLFLEAKDKFGNTSNDSSLQIGVDCRSSSVISSTFDSGVGCYVIIIRCTQVGTPLLRLSFPGAHQDLTIRDLSIVLPPLSASHSHIDPEDLGRLNEQKHVVGRELKFRLHLYDIFGTPLPSNESKADTQGTMSIDASLLDCACRHGSHCDIHWYKKDERLQQERNSLEVRLLHDTSTCELIFTPLITGRRALSLAIHGTNVEHPVELSVVPGPLVSITTVAHESHWVSYLTQERTVRVEAQNESDPRELHRSRFVSYPTQKRIWRVQGQNDLHERVELDPSEWSLVTGGPMARMKVIAADDATLEFHYTFTENGGFGVTLKSTNNRESYIEVPSFEVEVKSPPLDPERSSAILEQREPKLIFEEDRTPIQLRLALVDLFDYTGHVFHISNFKHDKLTVKVDGDEVRFSYSHTGYSQYVLFTIDDFNGAGCKDIQVCYDRRPFGKVCVDIVGVESYRQDRYLQLITDPLQIKCTGVPRRSLMGPDNANIRNINRILHLEDSEQRLLGRNVQTIQNAVFVDLDDFEIDIAREILRVLSLFVEGNHYRNQAWSLNEGRIEWRDKAKEAYDRDEGSESSECKEIKEKYSSLMDEGHRRASDSIFNFFNDGRSKMDIDLHGQLVGNEGNLLRYKKQLLGRGTISVFEVERLTKEKREKDDEAIRQLQQRLRQGFDHPWLEIIYGAGHHSQEGVQKIRPKVIKYMTGRGWRDYVESNEGALLVTLQAYTGTEPCLANFYCQACNRTWESGTSWKDTWQRCYKCDRNGVISECQPFKLRALEERPRRAGGELAVSRRDHRRLCQRCISSGVDCSTL